MSERVLVDGLGYEIAVGSEEELRRGLDEIDTAARGRGRPLIATLFANATEDDPPSLGIGLGGRDSVLIYSAGGWSGEGGCSVGPRVGEAALGKIAGFPYTAPFEDLSIKGA